MDLDQAINLCRSTRRDVRRLLAALERRSFYDVGHDVGHSASNGVVFDRLLRELVWLEQLITVENYPVIRSHPWGVFDLVNYYDRLIDQIEAKRLESGKLPPVVDSLYRWRDSAGKLAQVVCQMEDADTP